MIFFTELQMQGEKHIQVNSGLLNILKLAFNNQQIHVICDSVHENELIKNLDKVELFSFNNFSYTGDRELRKSKMFGKLIREIFLAYKIFKSAKSHEIEFIIFASAFPFTSIFLKFFSKIFKQRIIICLHGDIGVLKLKSNKITIKLFRLTVKMFFRFKTKYSTLLFYGESIKNKLFEDFPSFFTNNIIAIDHPYNYDRDYNLGTSETIIIANIGTGIMNKNSYLLYTIALDQKENILNGIIKFIQVGNVSTEVMSYSNDYVEIVNNNEFIPFEVFEKNILTANYFIYFFTENSLYDLCPSGTFFDALKYNKPIISLRNPFFNFYFKKLGDIGFLCDSIEEMNVLIDEIGKGLHKNRYLMQLEAISLAKSKLSFDLISKSFREQYLKLN